MISQAVVGSALRMGHVTWERDQSKKYGRRYTLDGEDVTDVIEPGNAEDRPWTLKMLTGNKVEIMRDRTRAHT